MALVVLQDQPYAPFQQRARTLNETLPSAGHDLRPRQCQLEGHGEETIIVEAPAIRAGDERARGVEVRLQRLGEVQLQGYRVWSLQE